MKLRLSDVIATAVEFEAVDLPSFRASLHDALMQYRSRFSDDAPRPHLHVWDGQWVDAGYGRGTHIVLHSSIFQDGPYLAEIWGRCASAHANAVAFKTQFAQMVDEVSDEARTPQLRVVSRSYASPHYGGNHE